MNLFFLHPSSTVTAQMMVDCHVRKMPLEIAQMLVTAFHERWFDGWQDSFLRHVGREPYKRTHANHPMSVWVRGGWVQMHTAIMHGSALCAEYTRRTGNIHACEVVIRWAGGIGMSLYFDINGEYTPPPLCMPDEFKTDDTYVSYQNYYLAKIDAWADDPKRAHLVKGGDCGVRYERNM